MCRGLYGFSFVFLLSFFPLLSLFFPCLAFFLLFIRLFVRHQFGEYESAIVLLVRP